MRCQQATELMSLELDHLLDQAQRRDLQTHLSECADCQQTWSAMRQVSLLLEDTPMVAPAPGFVARVQERITQTLAARQARKQLVTGYLILGAGVLLLLALPLTFLAAPLSSLGRALAQQPGMAGQVVSLLARLGAIVAAFIEACWLLGRTIVAALPTTLLAALGVFMAGLLAIWVRLVSGRSLVFRRSVVGS